jgi:exosome complex RNA-binding protein Csl4
MKTHVRESTLQHRDYGVISAMALACAGYIVLFMNQII